MATRIEDYRIVPVEGGGACVVGTIPGCGPWRTTEIRRFRRGEIETSSGSRYELGTQHASLWSVQLQMRRPQLHDKFAAVGLV